MMEKRQSDTVFVPARVTDNSFSNPEYRHVLENLTGWQKRAWLDGDWDIAAGQYFTTFRRDVHVIDDFDDTRAVEWFAALDYGFAHYTVALLGCRDGDGNMYIVDEHAERLWLPQRHAAGIKMMIARHKVIAERGVRSADRLETRTLEMGDLKRFVAGADPTNARMSVNVFMSSPVTLQKREFVVGRLCESAKSSTNPPLRRSGLQPRQLEMELPEVA